MFGHVGAVDDVHRQPVGASDELVAAVGRLSEAFEWVERARGRLFDFHQMMGHADFLAGEAAESLRDAGAPEVAARLERELVGRNVLEDRWTFEIVEEFDRLYYAVFRSLERAVRDELMDGRSHVHEAELKARRHGSGEDLSPTTSG